MKKQTGNWRSTWISRSARTLTWAALLATVVTAGYGCGPAKEEELADEDLSGMLDGENPYPNIRGGEVKGDKNFATLINKYPEGKAANGWAGFFWPYTGNGIAAGLSGGSTTVGRGGTSPAGRYDAARGGITQSQPWEVKNHGAGVPKVQGWWGHCNGWCAASALFPEPREAVKVNGIEFGIGDIKAILSEAGMSVSADFFGNRVDPWTMHQQRRVDDTVPGQYFLVLTNYMGKTSTPVLIDRDTYHEVWNQPLAGYRFEYPKPEDYKGCEGGICKINVRSTIWWYNDSGVPPAVQTPPFEWKDDCSQGYCTIEHRDLVMELWLDGPVEFGADGKITQSGDVVVTRDGEFFVGGNWLMGQYGSQGHPDYMWVPYSFVKPDPNEDYANPHIDIEWVKNHILVPGGRDDPSVRPSPIPTAPSPRPSPRPSPSPSPSSSGPPRPTPTTTSTSWPIPFPTSTSTPIPLPMPMFPMPMAAVDSMDAARVPAPVPISYESGSGGGYGAAAR